jgi:hypothetical protein
VGDNGWPPGVEARYGVAVITVVIHGRGTTSFPRGISNVDETTRSRRMEDEYDRRRSDPRRSPTRDFRMEVRVANE